MTQALCVEPNPFLIKTLEKNIKLNAAWKKVSILNRALDYSGQDQIRLSVCKNNLGSEVKYGNVGEFVAVKATTLSELITEYEIEEFALVSDAEGGEAGMIIRDATVLSRCRQMIIELHPILFEGEFYSVESLREKVESMHGFRLIARRHGLHVFEKG